MNKQPESLKFTINWDLKTVFLPDMCKEMGMPELLHFDGDYQVWYVKGYTVWTGHRIVKSRTHSEFWLVKIYERDHPYYYAHKIMVHEPGQGNVKRQAIEYMVTQIAKLKGDQVEEENSKTPQELANRALFLLRQPKMSASDRAEVIRIVKALANLNPEKDYLYQEMVERNREKIVNY